MKLSKVLLVVAVLAIALALVGCGAQTAAQAPVEEAAAAEQPAAKAPLTYKDMTVGFIQTGSEGGWRAANTASFKETAEQLGINLKFYDAQNKLENQVSAFHQKITPNPSLFSLRITWNSFAVSWASRLEVGSSRIRTLAAEISSARAMAAIC